MTSIRSALAVGGIALCTPCALAGATAGDFDGDGRDELLLRNADTHAWIYYDLEDGGGAAHALPLPTGDDRRFLGIGDFNGDGRDDVLFTQRDTRSWTYYAVQAPGSAPLAIASEALPLTSNPVFEFRGVGDLDGDGHDDLLLRNTDNGVWIAYLVRGADLELRRGLGATPRQVWAFAGMGDFNGDSRDDLLLRNTDTGAWVHYEMGANARSVLRRPGLTRNPSFALRGIGDLNGDGRDDLLLRNRTTGEWLHYEMNGARVTLRRGLGVPRDRALRAAAVGDFDGDGEASLLVRNITAGDWTGYDLSGASAVETRLAGVYRDRHWRADYAPAGPDDRGAVRKTDDGRIVLELSADETTVANPFDLDERTVVFTPDGQGSYTVDVRARQEWEGEEREPIGDGAEVDLPFPFEFAGRTWDSVHVSRRGVLSFGEKFTDPYHDLDFRFASMKHYARLIASDPVISALYKPDLGGLWPEYELDVATFPERVVVTWSATDYFHWPHGVAPEDDPLVQAVLHADGSVALRYRDITTGDGIVGLFGGLDDGDAIARGDVLFEMSDATDPGAPGYLDITRVTIHESGVPGTAIVEFTVRDAIENPPEGEEYSYRLSFDTDQPHWSRYDLDDQDFWWVVGIHEHGDLSAFNGTALPRDDPNRIAMLVDLTRYDGIGGSVIASGVEFHDEEASSVAASESSPAFVQLPAQPPPKDLSAAGSAPVTAPVEVFHYRQTASTDDLACRVTDRFGDVFDGIVFHADFRLDIQEAVSAWTLYGGSHPIGGIGPRDAQTPPCEAARPRGVWKDPVWMRSRWVADHSVAEGARFDNGLMHFAHEFSHSWLAALSYDRDGEPEALADGRLHWNEGLHAPAAFPWKAADEHATSTLGGRFWRANPDGTYTPAYPNFETGGFSWLDLYAMGLADAGEVPDTFYLRHLERVDPGDPDGPHTGERERVTIRQIIAAEGERDPARAESQSVFNIAFVYLLEPGADSPDSDLFELHREFRDRVPGHWAHITGERSELTTVVPEPMEGRRPVRTTRPRGFVPRAPRHVH